jgi:uncharacterized membrane protein YphA (DoxX/SURF4 family)
VQADDASVERTLQPLVSPPLVHPALPALISERSASANQTELEMKIATFTVRSLLGLIFVVFGLNFFFHFIPIPPPPEGPARDFITALAATPYLYVVGALEVFGGVRLLAGRLVPLGLTLLGPVIVNILCVHVFLDRSGFAMAIVISALTLFLLWRCRENFAGLVKNSLVSRVSRGHPATTKAATDKENRA